MSEKPDQPIGRNQSSRNKQTVRFDEGIAGGVPSLVKGTILGRACPKCKARPGAKCQRYIPGSGMWRQIKSYHEER
jgi:hypothetical protein